MIFLVVAIVSAILESNGIAAEAANVAKLIFFDSPGVFCCPPSSAVGENSPAFTSVSRWVHFIALLPDKENDEIFSSLSI